MNLNSLVCSTDSGSRHWPSVHRHAFRVDCKIPEGAKTAVCFTTKSNTPFRVK